MIFINTYNKPKAAKKAPKLVREMPSLKKLIDDDTVFEAFPKSGKNKDAQC